jgi:aerobic carbon-monoxide dehydrogenase small subunit
VNDDDRTVAFTLNGVAVESRIRPDETLLELIRDDFALYGARESCGQGVCGACTVEVDGLTVSSCLYWAVQLGGSQVNTIESPERDVLLDAVQQAFIDAGGFQCGFCTPGMIMMCRELLRQNPNPSDDEIRHWLSGSICRCGAYPEILAATRAAAAEMRAQARADRLPPGRQPRDL